MVKMNGTYKGGLRCQATHEPSGAELITDAPVDNLGQGRSFSPTDLVATALATCIVTTMGIWAKRNDIAMEAATFAVTKEMTATAPRRIAKLTVGIHVPGPLSDDQKERLEAAGRSCPVHKSLHPDVVCDIRFTWG